MFDISADCNPVPGVCPNAPPSKSYEGGFKVQLMRKDFALAVDAGKKANVNMTLAQKGLETYTNAANDSRYVDRDSRVVYKYLRNEAI